MWVIRNTSFLYCHFHLNWNTCVMFSICEISFQYWKISSVATSVWLFSFAVVFSWSDTFLLISLSTALCSIWFRIKSDAALALSWVVTILMHTICTFCDFFLFVVYCAKIEPKMDTNGIFFSLSLSFYIRLKENSGNSLMEFYGQKALLNVKLKIVSE